jgi:hypothetical protein
VGLPIYIFFDRDSQPDTKKPTEEYPAGPIKTSQTNPDDTYWLTFTTSKPLA